MTDDAIEITESHFKIDRFIVLTIRALIKLSDLPVSIRAVNHLPFNLTILVMGGDLSPSLTWPTITAEVKYEGVGLVERQTLAKWLSLPQF